MERRVNYKMQQPNVVIHSGIDETCTDEIERTVHTCTYRTSRCE